MEALTLQLNKTVSSAIDEFINKLSLSELQIDKQKAREIWNSSCADEVKIIETKKRTSSLVKKPIIKTTVAKKKDDGNVSKCIYPFQKGKKWENNELCGRKTSDKSETGNYCTNHLSHENKKKDEKEKKPVKKVTAKKAENNELETEVIKSLQEVAPIFSVKLNKFRNYEEAETGLLFDRKDSCVYGRNDAKGDIIPLTTEDIEMCKTRGFAYRLPEKLTSKEEDKQEDEEVELEEDDDEEEESEED
jgi:hypothetical protein